CCGTSNTYCDTATIGKGTYKCVQCPTCTSLNVQCGSVSAQCGTLNCGTCLTGTCSNGQCVSSCPSILEYYDCIRSGIPCIWCLECLNLPGKYSGSTSKCLDPSTSSCSYSCVIGQCSANCVTDTDCSTGQYCSSTCQCASSGITISGHVTSNGLGVSGATITISYSSCFTGAQPSPVTTTTNSNGYYTVTLSLDWSGCSAHISASKTGCTFTPSPATVTLTGNTITQDFSGSCQATCTSSWTCSDWSQCVSNTQTRTCTDSNNCESSYTESQQCTSTPCAGICTQNPCSSYQSCTSLPGTCNGYCCTGNDCSTSKGPYNISGYTITSSNSAIPSVSIQAKIGSCPGSSVLNTYTTNSQGYYFISSNNQQLCLTPSKTSYIFEPSSYSASLILTLAQQNFTGSTVPTCSLSDAYFAKSPDDNTIVTSAIQGDTVNLIVKGNSNCNNRNITFTIKEYDPGSSDDPVSQNPQSATFTNGQAKTSWIVEWQDDGITGGNPEYYFTAYEGSNTISSGTTDDRLLIVLESGSSGTCSNGNINSGEDCDGDNLNSKTCSLLGWDSGTLNCDASCHFDFSSCTPPGTCDNDNNKETGEECDGSDLNSITQCENIDQHYTSGTLSCNNCLYNESNCKTSSQCAFDCSENNICEGNCVFSSKCSEDPDCKCSNYVLFGYSECTKDECLDGWDTSIYTNHGENSGCCAIPTCYPSQCYSAWECSDWSACEQGKKTRTCNLKGTLPQGCPDYSPNQEKTCLSEAEFPFFSPIQIIYVILLLIAFYGYKLKRKH
ncbi:MAG: hypothetical protein V1815_02385, partial [Candidatus Woesearchaeota archaeon]